MGTDSQEAAAKHGALREEEEAKGTLQQQRLENEKVQAKAEAQARAEAKSIEGKAAVAQAKLEAEAMQIKIEHARALNDIEIGRNRQLAEIESEKFKLMVDAIGCNTIESIARAGPEMQAKLLSGLGIKSMMITDGKNPINLFQTASQMVEQTV